MVSSRNVSRSSITLLIIGNGPTLTYLSLIVVGRVVPEKVDSVEKKDERKVESDSERTVENVGEKLDTVTLDTPTKGGDSGNINLLSDK